MIHPYCDYIAHLIGKNLKSLDIEGMIDNVGKVKFDLDPADGSYLSTKKTIAVVDKNGTAYSITIEEVRNGHKV